jgi:hypothetical protein
MKMKKILIFMFISMIAINSFAQNDVNTQNDKTNSLKGLELYLSTNNSKIENSSLSFGVGANIVLFSQKPFNFVVNIFDFNNLVYYYRSERVLFSYQYYILRLD